MTSKKRRQRGSRTHGRGSHKNGRGAGNRGGRGDAGRDKHESHNYEPLGKSGFNRPPDAVEEDPKEVNISDIDEHLFYKIGTPGRLPETDVRVHARELDCVDSDHKVKVLGAGRRDDGAPSEPALAPDGGTASISIPVEVVADAFTDSARQRIETAGGTAVVPSSKDPVEIKTTVGQHGIMLGRDQRTVEGAERLVESGRVLVDGVVDQLVGYAQETEKYDEVYDVLLQNYRNKSEIEPIDAANAYSFKVYAEDSGFDTPDLDVMLEDYFANVEFSEAAMSDLSEGLPESIPANRTGDIMRDRREKIRDATVDVFNPDDMEELDRKISELQREYLYLVRNRIEATT